MDGDHLLKFLLVICCFLNSFAVKEQGLARDKRDLNILRVGMGLTVLADFLMIILELNAPGVLVFCMVQAVYNYRYTNIERVKVQMIIGTVAFIAAFLITGFNLLVALGAAYAVFLIYSLTGAFMAYPKYPSPNNLIVVIGMLLFFGCDVFVMLYNLPLPALYNEGARNFIWKGIWICYLPAQVLLSSSARRIISYDEEQ